MFHPPVSEHFAAKIRRGASLLRDPSGRQAVKFGIGSFPTLFGTQDGRDMQAIAKRLHWPLPLGEERYGDLDDVFHPTLSCTLLTP